MFTSSNWAAVVDKLTPGLAALDAMSAPKALDYDSARQNLVNL